MGKLAAPISEDGQIGGANLPIMAIGGTNFRRGSRRRFSYHYYAVA
jgi:hypothetical protein